MRRARWAALGVALVLCLNSQAQENDQVTFYVAKNGNDSWSGRLVSPNEAPTNGPFASLLRAQAAVRQTKKEGLKQPIAVMVRGGVYDLEETIVFTREDSGARDCPIVYQAYPGEQVVIRGGRIVTGWQPYRDGIFQADLKAQGMEGVSFHQLFYKGQRQILARYPNFDPQHPRTGGFLYAADRGFRPGEQFSYQEGTIPFEQWGDISQAEILTVFGHGWNFAITPILEVDRERCLISVQKVRRDFEPANRFVVQNVLGALDTPGEWFLDRKTSVLYFYPPDGAISDGDAVVPVLDNLIEVKGSIPYPHEYLNVRYHGSREECPIPEDAPPYDPVEHLTFQGFHLECARQNAIRLVGAKHCAVIGNRITNIGNVGINLGGVASAHFEVGNPRVTPAEGYSGGVGGGGQNILFSDPCEDCRVVGNDVWSVGSDGIFLYGTGNLAENNHVYDIGLFDKDCACINLWGERNVARRNELHDVPRNACFIKGIENVVELNNIHHTMLETCDGGAIRMCQRNLKILGNIIRFNRIVDTVGYGYPRGGNFQSPYCAWGVYLDDFTCGTTVYGNIIVRTGRGGVHFHGGSDNVCENNIIVDCRQYQFENNPIRDHPVAGNRVVRNIFYYPDTAKGEALLYRCGKWINGSVAWEKNLVWAGQSPVRVAFGTKELIEGWDAWQAKGLSQGSLLADPQFEDSRNDDYRLRPESPAWELGFQKIPEEKIGCYESPERASWPVQVNPALVREDPVLYSAPPRPLREDFEMEQANRQPRQGDISAPGKSSIRVTDETAATGKHSLKFTDAPGLPQRWQPRIYYVLDFKEGTARFSCDFRLDGKFPPQVTVDFRQYSDTGDKEYFSGPFFSVGPDGQFSVSPGKVGAVLKAPFDEWFKVEIAVPLGEGAPPTSRFTVTLKGKEPVTFEAPHVNDHFRRLERIVIMSNGDDKAVFYVDNVSCVLEKRGR